MQGFNKFMNKKVMTPEGLGIAAASAVVFLMLFSVILSCQEQKHVEETQTQTYLSCKDTRGETLFEGPVEQIRAYSGYWQLTTVENIRMSISTANATCVSTTIPKPKPRKEVKPPREYGFEADFSVDSSIRAW